MKTLTTAEWVPCQGKTPLQFEIDTLLFQCSFSSWHPGVGEVLGARLGARPQAAEVHQGRHGLLLPLPPPLPRVQPGLLVERDPVEGGDVEHLQVQTCCSQTAHLK